jgi:hypothetical protein
MASGPGQGKPAVQRGRLAPLTGPIGRRLCRLYGLFRRPRRLRYGLERPLGAIRPPSSERVMDDIIFIALGAACFAGLGLYGRLMRAL